MNQHGADLIARIHQEALEEYCRQRESQPAPVAAPEPPTIHFTELPQGQPDSVLCTEWNTYRREVARLLNDGNAGKHVLIKGTAILGLWDTEAEAVAAGYARFRRLPFFVHKVQEREPVVRCLSVFPCRNTLTLSRQAS